MFTKRMGMRPIYRSPEDGGGSGGGDGGNGGGDAGGDKSGQGSNGGGDANKGGGDQSQQRQETKFELPEAYREKAHFKNFKSHEDVYKALDGAQELIGKKTIGPIDYATATPEQIAEYHSKTAPADKSAYKFGEGADPEFSGAIADVFQKNGISAYQGEQIIKSVQEITGKIADASGKADTDPKVYNDLMIKQFGDKEKAGAAGKFLDNEIYGKHFSEEERKALNNLPSKSLALVDQAVFKTSQAYETRIAAILKEHGVTESGVQTSGGEGKNTVDIAAQRKAQRAEIRKIESNPHHTHDEISAAKAKLAKMY